MENEDKITFSYRELLNKLDFDELEENLESFLIFKSTSEIADFLIKHEVGYDEPNLKKKKSDWKDIKTISIDRKLSEILQIYSIIPAILVRSNLDFLNSVNKMHEINLIDGNFRIYLSSSGISPYQEADIIKKSFLKPTGYGVRIALLDSGIDSRNPYLNGRVLKRINITNEEDLDLIGHGTMVAGIICGKHNENTIDYEGIAPEANLFDIKIIPKSGLGYISNIMSGLEMIQDEDVDIIFFGAISPIGDDNSSILSLICDELKKNHILIAPAGNFGPENDTIGTPSSSKSVFCIGSTQDDNYISIFSSRDSIQNNELKPDLYFRGNNIVTTKSRNGILGRNYKESNYLCTMSGTSSSAAIFTGIIALLLELNPDLDKVSLLKKFNNSNSDLKLQSRDDQLYILDVGSLFKDFNSFFPNYLSFKQILKVALVSSLVVLFVLILAFILFWI